MGQLLHPSADKVQLLADINAVFGKPATKKITDFPEPYRKKILTAYRFTSYNMLSGSEMPVPISRETLDIV